MNTRGVNETSPVPDRRMIRLRARGRAAVMAWLAAAVVATPAGASGGGHLPRPRAAECPAADVWVVSTRRLPSVGCPPGDPAFEIERLVAGRWEPSDLGGLFDEPSRPLAFFIHGNRYESGEAKSHGVTVARRLDAAAAAPVRTVIFSWPSQQRGGLVASSRDNYRRAAADGHYLAALLARVPPSQPVALIGYSLGAVVASGALQDLATRPAAPDTCPWSAREGRTHLVMVAPAMRCDGLGPRGTHPAALTAVQRLTLVINSRDLALRMFPRLDLELDSPALGVAGMSRRSVPGHVEFTATDAAPVVGLRHALPEYFRSASLMQRIARGAVGGLAAE